MQDGIGRSETSAPALERSESSRSALAQPKREDVNDPNNPGVGRSVRVVCRFRPPSSAENEREQARNAARGAAAATIVPPFKLEPHLVRDAAPHSSFKAYGRFDAVLGVDATQVGSGARSVGRAPPRASSIRPGAALRVCAPVWGAGGRCPHFESSWIFRKYPPSAAARLQRDPWGTPLPPALARGMWCAVVVLSHIGRWWRRAGRRAAVAIVGGEMTPHRRRTNDE